MGPCCAGAGVLSPGGDSARPARRTPPPPAEGALRARRAMDGGMDGCMGGWVTRAATCAVRDAGLLSSLLSFREKMLRISWAFPAKANKREINSEWGN